VPLNAEWGSRLHAWQNELPNHFYHKLGAVELEGSVTADHLTPDEAQKGTFGLMSPGTTWGRGKFDYGWFRCRVTTPAEAAGRKFVLRHGFGGCEGLVFVNGQARGLLSAVADEPFVLSLAARKGETFDLLAEAYVGNHPRICSTGPVPLDREAVPEEHPANHPSIAETSFGVWVQPAFQLWLDVETLRQLAEQLDPDSQRVAEIDRALKDFTLIADFELPREEMLASFEAARERLAPLLAKKNGPTAPALHAFGHGHLDVAWLWPLAETERKIARTLSHQLALAEEFPWHRFLQSQPHEFWMLKRRHPELYERVRQAVADGVVIPDGAAWVEPDTNIPSGEALIRQILFGKRFFREEFGTDSRVMWLPDVFGFSAALPQILRGCGVPYFATGKIYWNYHGGDPFPHGIFTWQGIDGSEVLAEMVGGGGTEPEGTIRYWRRRRTKDARFDARMCAFGHGDGGGGPAVTHLEFARRQFDLEGCPKFRVMSPGESFDELAKKGPPPARYVGELYYQCHRGTLTSQAKTKLGNRRSELALREAELWSVAAAARGSVFPAEDVAAAWRTVLLNQFHDILPGSSIARVYEEAEADHERVLGTARAVSAQATAALTEPADAVTVFNSLSWERPVLVDLPEGWAGAADADGVPLPVQESEGLRKAEVAAPSCGWTTLARADAAARAGGAVEAAPSRLENERIRVELDATGRITGLVDKATGREFADGLLNDLRMFKDVPSDFDAWDIDSMCEMQPVALDTHAEVEVVATGPLFAALRVRRTLGRSEMTQDILLRRNSRRVDFHTVIDWRERHKLLKAAFETNVHADEALHEIQFGHLARPNHRSRPFDADRFEVCNHKWTALVEGRRGLAVLNDCKYGVHALGGTIGLSLLRAPLAPDMHADRGRQEFTYAVMVWDGCSLADSGVVREGYDLNVPPTVAEGAGGAGSLFAVDADNVIIDTVKPAEDGSGDVVVRLYEAMRTATRCTLRTALPAKNAVETDMLENPAGPLDLADGRLNLDLRPFEIKTVRLKA